MWSMFSGTLCESTWDTFSSHTTIQPTAFNYQEALNLYPRYSTIQVWWDYWSTEEKLPSRSRVGWLEPWYSNDYCCIINIAGPLDHAHHCLHNGAPLSLNNVVTDKSMVPFQTLKHSELTGYFFIHPLPKTALAQTLQTTVKSHHLSTALIKAQQMSLCVV